MKLDLLVGSGGVLSHAPRRVQQSAMMMIDAFLPEGVTELAVDSIFMMPQLGVLVRPCTRGGATQVFERDCLIRLGTCIAPVGNARDGDACVRIKLMGPRARCTSRRSWRRDMALIPLPADGAVRVRVTLEPDRASTSAPARARRARSPMRGGVVGLIVDARGRRPFELPTDDKKRIEQLRAWNRA